MITFVFAEADANGHSWSILMSDLRHQLEMLLVILEGESVGDALSNRGGEPDRTQ
jgi:hypothetical protein